MQCTFQKYSDGKTLYGDDFSPDQIEEWFRDEQEGYYALGERKPEIYSYHALNWWHGFRHLPSSPFEHVLGIGSAFGDEFRPLVGRAKRITILEPSDGFSNPKFEYVKPSACGCMPFADNAFDLITCFGVLHHIPNVSTVVREMVRCMKPEGWLLVREPNHSMGNWDRPRRGLTRRERGIPLHIMHKIVVDSGLQIVRERRCMYSLTARLQALLPKGRSAYNSRWIIALDDYLCNLPVWSGKYHAANFIQRFRPWDVFLVLQKLDHS